MIDSWAEGLGEGRYIVPTVGTGYTYEQAIATALGLSLQHQPPENDQHQSDRHTSDRKPWP